MQFFVRIFVLLISLVGVNGAYATEHINEVRYGTEDIDGVNIFYREAGNPSKKAVVLLHGFPSSSHMYRKVLASLGDDFYLIAPDYPGFGDSDFPAQDQYNYTFDNIADTIDKFINKKGLKQFTLMVHDYGAPIGFRIATKQPNRVNGLIVMNGNAYEEGLSPEGWAPIRQYWKDKNQPHLEQEIANQVFSLGGLKWQYTHGTRHPEKILPDNWNLDFMKFSREGQHDMQLGLFFDYQHNVSLYPTWQKYLIENQPPTLLVWGKNDVFFPVSGAEGYKRDLKNIDYNILDTGHFALEEESHFIISKMRSFLQLQVQ